MRIVIRSLENDQLKNLTPWPESASELYRPSDSRLLAKLVPTFADRRCHVVSVTDPYGRILGFLDRRMISRSKNGAVTLTITLTLSGH
jgi:CBS-domain-containing membrane protein